MTDVLLALNVQREDQGEWLVTLYKKTLLALVWQPYAQGYCIVTPPYASIRFANVEVGAGTKVGNLCVGGTQYKVRIDHSSGWQGERPLRLFRYEDALWWIWRTDEGEDLFFNDKLFAAALKNVASINWSCTAVPLYIPGEPTPPPVVPVYPTPVVPTKPYRCSICGAGFDTYAEALAHIASAHPAEPSPEEEVEGPAVPPAEGILAWLQKYWYVVVVAVIILLIITYLLVRR